MPQLRTSKMIEFAEKLGDKQGRDAKKLFKRLGKPASLMRIPLANTIFRSLSVDYGLFMIGWTMATTKKHSKRLTRSA